MDCPADELNQLRQLLQSEPPKEDMQDVEASNLRLLVGKRFVRRRDFERATKTQLQDNPGLAMQALLIDALLRTFRPAVLQTGIDIWLLRVQSHLKPTHVPGPA